MEKLRNLTCESVSNSENLDKEQDEMYAHKRLVTLTDNVEENFFSLNVVNGRRELVHISKACLKIYGYPPENFLAEENFWFKVIHPDDKDRIAKLDENLYKGEKSIREYRIICNDGTIKWVSNKVIPTLDKDGKLIRLDGYTTDITERKNAELKIERYNTLMYQISHDLRGPLNSAKNYIDIAIVKVKDETAINYLMKINQSYDKLEHHILSLLDLGRLNRTEVAFEKIDTIPFVRNIIATLDGIKDFDQIKFSTDIKIRDDLYSDRQYLQSILYNLINNAIKFRRNIPDSFINVSMNFENNRIIIRVSDNGMGVPKEIRCKVFNMFVKGGTESTGNGLGLYIVKNLVTKLKGEVSLESEENKGTTFTIALPINTMTDNVNTPSS
jgi:PAS domain S-box-containing protein